MSGAELSRREFAEALALAALVPVLGTGLAPVRLPATAALAPEPRALADSLAAAIRAQYGERLSEADLVVITRQIEASLERAAKVRRVPLAIGDEPDFVFSPVRAPDQG